MINKTLKCKNYKMRWHLSDPANQLSLSHSLQCPWKFFVASISVLASQERKGKQLWDRERCSNVKPLFTSVTSWVLQHYFLLSEMRTHPTFFLFKLLSGCFIPVFNRTDEENRDCGRERRREEWVSARSWAFELVFVRQWNRKKALWHFSLGLIMSWVLYAWGKLGQKKWSQQCKL